MVATIIGWYGTETLGDIAILDGIIEVLAKKNYNHIYLGSLFPFYSKRTLLCEKNLFNEKVSIDIFNVKDEIESDGMICASDLLIFGGGPLSDISALYLMKRCFETAKKHDIKSVVMGCGVGTFYKKIYLNLTFDIFNMAEKVALRDETSCNTAHKLFPKITNLEVIGDPAIISIDKYLANRDSSLVRENYAVVNYLEYPQNIYRNRSCFKLDDYRLVIERIAEKFDHVYLLPHMMFCAGGDDRRFLLNVIYESQYTNIEVLQEPISVKNVYELTEKAVACLGMRHHAVVIQTIVNGNNLILDYTEPNTGKTQAFIKDLHTSFYNDRIFSVQGNDSFDIDKFIAPLFKSQRYEWDACGLTESRYIAWMS